jgi:thiol-disulfide isomerase/thioredoxin
VKEQEVITNLTFQGFADPDYLCKPLPDQVLDRKTLVTISFKDYHLGDPKCPAAKRKLLWLKIGSGWCSPCRQAAAQIEEMIQNGEVDGRVAYMEILLQDANGDPASTTFLRQWVDNPLMTLSTPVVIDPTYKMGNFFDIQYIPYHMLIELETMKISKAGMVGIPDISEAISRYFAANP